MELIKFDRQLYYAFIFSRINYGIQIYGTCSTSLLSKIQTLSNRLLKFLLKLDFMTPTLALHKDLKILTVSDIVNVNIAVFVSNCLRGDCPSLFREYFTYPTHRYPSREPKLHVPSHKTALASTTVKIKGANLWNTLPTSIKEKFRLKSFSKILKDYYISKY